MCADWDDEDYNEELESVYGKIKAERARNGEDVDAPITVTQRQLIEERRISRGEPELIEKPNNQVDLITKKINTIALIGMAAAIGLGSIDNLGILSSLGTNITGKLFFAFLGLFTTSLLIQTWLGNPRFIDDETNERLKNSLGRRIGFTIGALIVIVISIKLMLSK